MVSPQPVDGVWASTASSCSSQTQPVSIHRIHVSIFFFVVVYAILPSLFLRHQGGSVLPCYEAHRHAFHNRSRCTWWSPFGNLGTGLDIFIKVSQEFWRINNVIFRAEACLALSDGSLIFQSTVVKIIQNALELNKEELLDGREGRVPFLDITHRLDLSFR